MPWSRAYPKFNLKKPPLGVFLRKKAIYWYEPKNTFCRHYEGSLRLSFGVQHQYIPINGFFHSAYTNEITGRMPEWSLEKCSETLWIVKKPPPWSERGNRHYRKSFWQRNPNFNGFWTIRSKHMAMGLGKGFTQTFWTYFRAEELNTSRHFADCWMIETRSSL